MAGQRQPRRRRGAGRTTHGHTSNHHGREREGGTESERQERGLTEGKPGPATRAVNRRPPPAAVATATRPMKEQRERDRAKEREGRGGFELSVTGDQRNQGRRTGSG